MMNLELGVRGGRSELQIQLKRSQSELLSASSTLRSYSISSSGDFGFESMLSTRAAGN